MRKTTRPIPTIPEDLDTLKQRLAQTRQAIIKQRLHLLMLLKTDPDMTRQRAADHLALHRNTITRWLRLYQQGALEALLTTRPVGAPTGQKSLPPEVLAQLQARLKTPEGFTSYGQVQQWLQQTFDLAIAYPTLHHIIRYQLKAKLKRARPSHAKKTSL
jgi:transposase